MDTNGLRGLVEIAAYLTITRYKSHSFVLFSRSTLGISASTLLMLVRNEGVFTYTNWLAYKATYRRAHKPEENSLLIYPTMQQRKGICVAVMHTPWAFKTQFENFPVAKSFRRRTKSFVRFCRLVGVCLVFKSIKCYSSLIYFTYWCYYHNYWYTAGKKEVGQLLLGIQLKQVDTGLAVFFTYLTFRSISTGHNRFE